MPPVHSCWPGAIYLSAKEVRAVQHDYIACVAQVAVSLQHFRHHFPGIVIATGSERAEKLVPMLLLNVAQKMFRADKLLNEDEDLLPCVFVQGKNLH